MTLDEIRGKAENDLFIKKMKMQVSLKERNKNERSISAFAICDDVLLYADRVVKRLVLQKKILKEFHLGHPGISRMMCWMQSYTYWLGMDENFGRVVKTCRSCTLAAKAPSMIQTIASKDIPWSRIHIDYVGPLTVFFF